jgi:hypothetical protein
MKYLKKFNEELSPELLNKAAGERTSPQQKKIGAEADLRKNLQDPEYVKAEQGKNYLQEKKSEIIKKYSIFRPEGMNLEICIFKIINYSNGSIRTEYEPIGFRAIANFDTKEIEIYLESSSYLSWEDQLHFKASFNEKGIKFDNIRDWISDNKDDYYITDILKLDDTSSSIQTSIVGFGRETLNTLSSMIKEFYPQSNVTATNFDITSHGETKKAGILNKHFNEDCQYFDAGKEAVEYLKDLVKMRLAIKYANNFAIPSLKNPPYKWVSGSGE